MHNAIFITETETKEQTMKQLTTKQTVAISVAASILLFLVKKGIDRLKAKKKAAEPKKAVFETEQDNVNI